MDEKQVHTEKSLQKRARAVSSGTPANPREISQKTKKAEVHKRTNLIEQVDQLAKNNRKQDVLYSKKQLITLLVSCCCFLLLSFQLISREAGLNTVIGEFNRLQSSYETLLIENDELEAKIRSEIDVNEIYEIATKQMGMIFPKKNQIILYEKTEREQITQNETIPKE